MSAEHRPEPHRRASPPAGDALADELKDVMIPPRPDLSLRDYVAQLLSIGAHVEHALMVQYLYAAYSLRAEHENDRERVERWRDALLTVAREEMGHLLTVQNILTLLGAPTDFGRDSSLWASQFYPFRFGLAPFSRETLVRFIFAEMPAEEAFATKAAHARPQTFAHNEEEELRKALEHDIDRQQLRQKGHRVGPTYAAIIKLLSDVKGIPDSAFDEASYERQASFDEWGRNYRPQPTQLTPEGDKVENKSLPPPSGRDALVWVRRVATRNDAVEALRELSEQGEAPHLGKGELSEPSHYQRFFEIYRDLQNLKARETKGAAEPAIRKKVIRNPTTRSEWADLHTVGEIRYTFIAPGRAHFLAQIFNQRYRLLLNYLAHTFRIARPARFDQPNLRSMLMHRAFAEMYNLKTLAGLLVELPASEAHDEARLAAPPFELPPTLALPMRETDIWRGHRDLIATSADVMRRFLAPEAHGVTEYASEKIRGSAAEAYIRTLVADRRLDADMDRRHSCGRPQSGGQFLMAAILSLRLLPPLAIARLGSAETPMDNYTLSSPAPDAPLDFRALEPRATLVLGENAQGEIEILHERPAETPLQFKDLGPDEKPRIRPVAPFIEAFAEVEGMDDLQPLTPQLLAENGLKVSDVKWSVNVANRKVVRRTGDERDAVVATVTDISHHKWVDLPGRCAHFRNPDADAIDFGRVGFVKPTAAHPQIRLRFHPAKGLIYGPVDPPKAAPDTLAPHLTPYEVPAARSIYKNPDGAAPGTAWRGLDSRKAKGFFNDTLPPALFAIEPPAPNWLFDNVAISRGYLDDACDGFVELRVGSVQSRRARLRRPARHRARRAVPAQPRRRSRSGDPRPRGRSLGAAGGDAGARARHRAPRLRDGQLHERRGDERQFRQRPPGA